MAKVHAAVAAVLDGVEPWQRESVRDAIRSELLDRAARRYVEKWGRPPVATRSTDWVCWQLMTDFERALWRTLDDE